MSNEEELTQLVVAIVNFLCDQLSSRFDFSLDDRESIELAIELIQLTFDVEEGDVLETQSSRPLLDIYNQFAYPISVKDRKQAENHKSHGNILMSEERYQEASEEYTRAIEIDKWNSIYYCNRASAYLKQEKCNDAITDCRKALTLNRDYAEAYGTMGQAYALMDKTRRANTCFKQALELDPENVSYQQQFNESEEENMQSVETGAVDTISNSLLENGEIISNNDASNELTDNDDCILKCSGCRSLSCTAESSLNGHCDPSSEQTENVDSTRKFAGSKSCSHLAASRSKYYDSEFSPINTQPTSSTVEEQALIFGYDSTSSGMLLNNQIYPSYKADFSPNENDIICDCTEVLTIDSKSFGFSDLSLNTNRCSSKEGHLGEKTNPLQGTNNETDEANKRYDESRTSDENMRIKNEGIEQKIK